MLHRQFYLFLLSLVAASLACQTVAPSAEPPPTPTRKRVPLDSIVPQAKDVCAATENAPVAGGFIRAPLLALKRAMRADGQWEVETLLNNQDGVLAEDAEEVRAVACILEERSETGTYEDGETAISTIWTIWFVSWPAGESLGWMRLVGGPPPIKTNIGAGIGDPPVLDFVNVLIEAKSRGFLAVGIGSDLVDTAVTPDERLLAVVDANGQIAVWNLASGKVMSQFAGLPALSFTSDLALSPDGSLAAVFDSSESTTMVFDVETGENLYSLITEAPAFSPDGAVLASGNPTEEHIVTHEIWLTDARTGSLIAKIPDARVGELTFSADGRWLVSMDPFGEITLWDAASQTVVDSLDEFDAGGADSLALSPDGRLVAVQSGSSGVRVWETGSWTLLYSTPGENGAFQANVRFSADGRTLAFAGPESVVDIFASDAPPAPGDLEALAMAPRKVTLVNLDDLSVTEMQMPQQVTDFFFAPEDEGLYALLAGGALLLIGDVTP